jgi:hypothetical protein
VSRLIKDKHAERSEQVVEEAYAGVTVASTGALSDHHVPEGFLHRGYRSLHRTKESLVVPEPDRLVRAEQVFVDLFCQPVPVFRGKFRYLFAKIPFHLLDIPWRMPEDKNCDPRPEFSAGDSLLEIPAFARDVCAGIVGVTMILVDNQDHRKVQYLQITDFLPQEYSFCNPTIICPNIFILITPTITHGDMP